MYCIVWSAASLFCPMKSFNRKYGKLDFTAIVWAWTQLCAHSACHALNDRFWTKSGSFLYEMLEVRLHQVQTLILRHNSRRSCLQGGGQDSVWWASPRTPLHPFTYLNGLISSSCLVDHRSSKQPADWLHPSLWYHLWLGLCFHHVE